MNSLEVSAIVFCCTMGGALVGLVLQRRLPEAHLSKESQHVISQATGLVASMAALVLGLLVASATSQFNDQKSGYQQLATNLLLLDKSLGHFGPESQPVPRGAQTFACHVDRRAVAARW